MRSDGPTVDHTDIVPTSAERPARSVGAAVLFNLSGLGVGFAYLGRWGAAAGGLAITGGLVAFAFGTDAADRPLLWVVPAGLWLGAAAVAAGLLARRHPRPVGARARAVPVVGAALLVVGLVGGFVGYRVAGSSVYEQGLAAQARADCATAVERFDTVDGPFELTMSADVPAARLGRAQCLAYLVAVEAGRRGDHAAAVRGYQDFRRAHPGTVLVGFAARNLEATYDAWAQQLRAAGDQPGAIRVYRDLLVEFDTPRARADLAATYLEQAEQLRAAAATGDGNSRAGLARAAVDALLVVADEFAATPSAARVPQALADTYAAATGLTAQGQYCAGLPVLDSFASLPATGPTADVVRVAHADRAPAMFECGLADYRGSSYSGAIDRLTAFLGAYPDDPRAAQARSAIIAATVLAESGGAPLPLPAPLTNNVTGPNPVTVFNNTPYEQHVYLVGPTAHEFVLPPCPDCTEQYVGPLIDSLGPADPCGDPTGRPSLTLMLGSGTFTWFSRTTDESTPVRSDVIESGYSYSTCVYVERYL
ncbi:hypothetical protein [Pseudonocardia humida]|uniref:Tetratricopeptide repeat protein n=1 Tax=Pseudonocardia humida TaxID=2800819 RepID=A0ABT0ZZK7_9PSEU|nr:hypothetical protein [Pseudonocardia humida]MCO1656199.1 hypothetical protein [Pseudonocardia humida]